MALSKDLVGVKIPWAQAELLGEDIVTVAGAGTTQGAGTVILPAQTMVRGTTTGGAVAFTFSSSMPLGKSYWFTNTSATEASVFPPTGGAINGGSTNAAIAVSVNETIEVIRQSATAFIALVSSVGSGSFTSLAVSGSATVGTTLGVTGDITAAGLTGGDASLGITGLAAAQGGDVALVGGTSATTGLAGGGVLVTGGTGGATGIGGVVTVLTGPGQNIAAAGTATAGGALSITTGAGGTTATGTGGASGVVTLASGAGGAATGAGTGGAGAAVGVTGGVGGATTTSVGGAGGSVTVTGGAGGAASGAGTGGAAGAVILQPGTGGTTSGGTAGKSASVYNRGLQVFHKQGAPAAKTVTAGLSAADLMNGIITTTGATGPSIHQLPTGTALKAEFPNIAADDSFEFSIINTGTGASDDATITVNTDITIIGSPTIGSLTDATIISGSGRFLARFTTGVTWIVYRLA